MMGWLLLIGAGLLGVYGYRKLQILEQEIRRELAEQETVSPAPAPSAPAAQPATDQPSQPAEEAPDLSARLLRHIAAQPGLPQTKLYAAFPAVSRSRLQKQLLQLERQGRIRRSREGSSYRLHPAG